ncbi:MAG: hypothetical protein Ta2F_00850 [Termitinemataceae bacterium]|nr:MAG: hypothetical protein Ta2F_00850 [Termitinemataceae bacterium]
MSEKKTTVSNFFYFSFFVGLFGFSIFSVPLYAKGAAQEIEPINKTWTLCVTEFDVSQLPQARQTVGSLVTRNIVINLVHTDQKLRRPDEYEYYRMYGAYNAEKDAAAKIVAKQTERDKLLYQGLSDVQYKKGLKKTDDELEKLRKNYNQARLVPPIVEIEPEFNITKNSGDVELPAAPITGSEYIFCKTQKADGFVSGKITEYYGRFYVQIALWTISERKYSYLDSVIFSVNDLTNAVTELTNRLIDEITGMKSSGIRIKATPENAVIVIGDYFAGRGEAQVLNFTPGDVDISIYAENHETTNATITLNENELADISVDLAAAPLSNYSVDIKIEPDSKREQRKKEKAGIVEDELTGEETAAVYEGSYYKGQTPIDLMGITGDVRQYNVITKDNKTAQTIFKIADDALILKPKTEPKEGRTEKARRKFYGAYGRFWITLPFAILTNNMYKKYYNEAVRIHSVDSEYGYGMMDKSTTMLWVTRGFWGLAGAFLAETLTRMVIYIYQANKATNPISVKAKPMALKPEPVEPEQPATELNPETEIDTKP